MSVVFDVSGSLDVATDPSDLPETGDGPDIYSGALTRCKNLRINQKGKAVTRDGSAKLHSTAIETAIWWIEEQAGERYTFAGESIYRDETSIESDLTAAQWAAAQYSAFNDLTLQIYALNGTDRKRIQGDDVYEWGIDAPEDAPTLAAGTGVGLTGEYNAIYTYARKVGDALVAESNPSPAADNTVVLANQSLAVDVTQPTDPQVTHIRLYRTLSGQGNYYLDRELPVMVEYTYGYTFAWEITDEYLNADEGFEFTIEDAIHGTSNCYTWEDTYATHDSSDVPGTSGGGVQDQDQWTEVPWWNVYYTGER